MFPTGTPKTSDTGADTTPTEETRQEIPDAPFSMADAAPKDHRVCTLTFGEQGNQTEYAVTHSPVGYLLNRSHVRETTRWPIHCLYDEQSLALPCERPAWCTLQAV